LRVCDLRGGGYLVRRGVASPRSYSSLETTLYRLQKRRPQTLCGHSLDKTGEGRSSKPIIATPPMLQMQSPPRVAGSIEFRRRSHAAPLAGSHVYHRERSMHPLVFHRTMPISLACSRSSPVNSHVGPMGSSIITSPRGSRGVRWDRGRVVARSAAALPAARRRGW